MFFICFFFSSSCSRSKLLNTVFSEKEQIPFQSISEEAKINYENLKSLSYSSTLFTNFETIDTLRTFQTEWKDNVSRRVIENEKKKLYSWLKYKLNLDTLVVK